MDTLTMIPHTLLFLGGVGIQELLLLMLFLAIPGILWLWAFIDCVTGNFAESNNKLIWILVIIFVPFLGSILYLIIGRGQKVKG